MRSPVANIVGEAESSPIRPSRRPHDVGVVDLVGESVESRAQQVCISQPGRAFLTIKEVGSMGITNSARASIRIVVGALIAAVCVACSSGPSTTVAGPEQGEASETPAGVMTSGTVVVQWTVGADFVTCDQRGPIQVVLTNHGGTVRGDVTGDAPLAESAERSCKVEAMSAFFEIDTTDPDRLHVGTCVVNGETAEDTIAFRRQAAVEVECNWSTDPGLRTTTFYVDL